MDALATHRALVLAAVKAEQQATRTISPTPRTVSSLPKLVCVCAKGKVNALLMIGTLVFSRSFFLVAGSS